MNIGQLNEDRIELLLRQSGESYHVAPGWFIGWSRDGWQVFYQAIDAYFRLHKNDNCFHTEMRWATFANAWKWIDGLSVEDLQEIIRGGP